MAITNGEAIVARVRELLEDAEGDLRTIAASTYSGDVHEDADPARKAAFAVVRPRVEVIVRSGETHPSTTVVNSNKSLQTIVIDVLVIRGAFALADAKDDTRDSVQGLAIDDSERIRQVLEYPGNMTALAVGTATGLVSGCLRFRGRTVDLRIDKSNARIEVLNTFEGVVLTSPATS